jgi:hypothetical protein
MKSEAKCIVPGHYQIHPPDSLDQLGGAAALRRAQEFTRDRISYLLMDYKFLNGDFQGVSNSTFCFSVTPSTRNQLAGL